MNMAINLPLNFSMLRIALPSGILLTSLAGSAHCVGMCGGLILNFTQSKTDLVWYHLGRLISYSLLGYLAGGLGSFIFDFKYSKSIATMTTLAFALGLIMVGISRFLALPRWLNPHGFTRWFHMVVGSLSKTVLSATLAPIFMSRAQFLKPLALGSLSGFLPCGWLYTYVIAAAATQSPWLGFISLAIFWVGTLPALTLSTVIFRRTVDKMRLGSPRLSGAILVGLGIFSLALHMTTLLEMNNSISTSRLEATCNLHSQKPTNHLPMKR